MDSKNLVRLKNLIIKLLKEEDNEQIQKAGKILAVYCMQHKIAENTAKYWLTKIQSTKEPNK